MMAHLLVMIAVKLSTGTQTTTGALKKKNQNVNPIILFRRSEWLNVQKTQKMTSFSFRILKIVNSISFVSMACQFWRVVQETCYSITL